MNKNELRLYIEKLGLSISDEQFSLLEKYQSYTLETNEKFNLTAIKDEDEFREKMIFDSIIPLSHVDIKNKTIIDVGTGAGFPGMILTILSGASVTMLDSTKKKIDFIKYFLDENHLSATAISDRAENYASNNRNKFDYATARAVSNLSILLELIMPLLKIGGTFIAMKGKGAKEEIAQAKNAFSKLGCEIEEIYEDELPISKEKRFTILIKKKKETNKKYPRSYADILKKPL